MVEREHIQPIVAVVLSTTAVVVGFVAYFSGLLDSNSSGIGTEVLVITVFGLSALCLAAVYEYQYGDAPLKRSLFQVILAVSAIGLFIYIAWF